MIKRFEIKKWELLNVHGYMNPYYAEQFVLQLLSKKGAPLKGTIFLTVDFEKYDLYSERSPEGDYLFEFKEKK